MKKKKNRAVHPNLRLYLLMTQLFKDTKPCYHFYLLTFANSCVTPRVNIYIDTVFCLYGR